MSRFRLKATPGSEGTLTGTLRRREGDDFRVAAVLGGVEWELPATEHLVARCAALVEPWQQCEVILSLRWAQSPGAQHPRAIWRVKRRSLSEQLKGEHQSEMFRASE